VKHLQLAGFTVAFDNKKATIRNKETSKIAFICEKGSDGMFYLRGEQQINDGSNLTTFLARELDGAWKDVLEPIDKKGETIKKPNQPKPTK
jgi:hypothetical protein